jgi:CheY-like chemotaxis protein
VVDDNCLNKSLFERTVNNMFKKQKRVKPIYTFAADGTFLPFVNSLLPLNFEDSLTNSEQTTGQEAVDIFRMSMDPSLSGTGTVPLAFDCVFMDREMPVMNGVEATRQIVALQSGPGRELCVPVPVIGLSASVESADSWRAAGMTYLLGKPFTRTELSRVLRLVDTRRKAATPDTTLRHSFLRILKT